VNVIDQIKHEIDRLNGQILKREAFNEEDGVNLNALVCMLRYAAWKEPNKLYDYFTRKGCNWKQATINPNIVKRFSLHEPEGDDGAQLRIHIFDDAEETSKHNHQRSFITMCIQGCYEYRYYKIVDDGDSEIEIWNRVNGKFEPSGTKIGTIRQVSHSAEDIEGTLLSPGEDGPHIFDTDSKPLYVDHSWFHTVHPHNQDEAVITVLIRREKEKQGLTEFIKGPDDKEFDQEEDPRPATEKEAQEMFEIVKKALTKGAKVSGENLIINTNVIQEFMIPRSKIARVTPSYLDNQLILEELKEFMQMNNFSFTPITELRDGVETLVRFVDENGNPYFVSKEERLDPNTPILFGIMYTILSPKYVVPIVDETTNEFIGILSLHDIMENLARLSGPMVKSALNSNQEKSIVDYTKLLDALSKLNKTVEKDNYVWNKSHIGEANNVLGILNELILDQRMLNLNIPDSTTAKNEGTWLEQISGEVFYVGALEKSKSLLQELQKVCDFSTFIHKKGKKEFTIFSSTENGKTWRQEPLQTLDSESNPHELIQWIRESEDQWPVYIYSKKQNYLGIISTEELFSRTGIQQVSEQLSALGGGTKNKTLSILLLKAHQRRPKFGGDDFNNLRQLFLDS
jgi:hypothetical protein